MSAGRIALVLVLAVVGWHVAVILAWEHLKALWRRRWADPRPYSPDRKPMEE